MSSIFLCRLIRHIEEDEELTLVFTAWEGLFICWTFTVDMCNRALSFSFSSKLLAPGYSETYYNSSGKEVTTSPQIMVKLPPGPLLMECTLQVYLQCPCQASRAGTAFTVLVFFFSSSNNYLIDLLTLLYFPKNMKDDPRNLFQFSWEAGSRTSHVLRVVFCEELCNMKR